MEFLFISCRLIKPTWQHSGSTLPYNGEMNHCGACQRPNVHCRLYVGGKEWNEVWQCHREVAAGFRVSRGILEPVQTAPLLEFCELEMRGALPLSAGSKLESLLWGSVDHEKTPVNPPPSSLLGQSWLVTSEAPVTQGLNPAALHSLPYAATGNLWPQVHRESHTCMAASKAKAGSVVFLNRVVASTGSAQINKTLMGTPSLMQEWFLFKEAKTNPCKTKLCFLSNSGAAASKPYHENMKIVMIS